MLGIRAIMNSSMEQVMNFKTACCYRLFDMNLEIHLENKGSKPVVVSGYFDLEGERGVKRVETLFPPGPHKIEPGDFMAVYCMMDENLWTASRTLIFYDQEGNRYLYRTDAGQKPFQA